MASALALGARGPGFKSRLPDFSTQLPATLSMKRDHTQFICDISELGGLFKDAGSLDTFLQRIVEMAAAHMNADV